LTAFFDCGIQNQTSAQAEMKRRCEFFLRKENWTEASMSIISRLAVSDDSFYPKSIKTTLGATPKEAHSPFFLGIGKEPVEAVKV
jgi:hypothetical protein